MATLDIWSPRSAIRQSSNDPGTMRVCLHRGACSRPSWPTLTTPGRRFVYVPAAHAPGPPTQPLPPLQPQPLPLQGMPPDGFQPPFYVVSAAEAAILIILTFGVYSFYWFYKHWRAVQHADGLSRFPFWRFLLSILITYNLLARIEQGIKARHSSTSVSPVFLTVLYLSGYIISAAPLPWSIIELSSSCCPSLVCAE
jgi:hypothetical protein